MSADETSTAHALREATAALLAGSRTGGRGSVVQAAAGDARVLAADLGEHLDALLALLGTADLDPVPSSSAEQSLHALAQHLRSAATLAHDVTTHRAAHSAASNPSSSAPSSSTPAAQEGQERR